MKTLKQLISLLILTLFFMSCGSSNNSVYVNINTRQLDFGTVYMGSSSELKFKIINDSNETYDITDVSIKGADSSEFAIISGWAGTITIQSESELEITVEFTPTTTGVKDALIEVSHSYLKEDTPKTIAVKAKSVIDAKLQSNPTSHHFGFIPVGNSDEIDITLSVDGSSTLEISSMIFEGIGASSYEFKSGWNGSTFPIAVGNYYTVTVKFSPDSDGDKSVRLKIEHNGSNSPVEVNLTGGGGYGYIKEDFPLGMTSIRNTGTEIVTVSYLDDEYYNFNLGFSFKYFGIDYSTIWICDNGWVSFGQDPGDPSYENFALPSTTVPEAGIYPFWDDVEFNRSDVPEAKWVYEVQGQAPNRVFVVEWYRLNRYNTAPVSVATYQLRLYETTNVIEFHYSDNPDDWANSSWTATIGLEDDITGKFYEITDSPMINKCPTHNYRFIP